MFGVDGDDILTGQDGLAETSRDFLNGGADNNLLLSQSSNVVTDGESDDKVVIQAKPAQDNVTITDFQVGLDKLLITWEDIDEPDFEVEKIY